MWSTAPLQTPWPSRHDVSQPLPTWMSEPRTCSPVLSSVGLSPYYDEVFGTKSTSFSPEFRYPAGRTTSDQTTSKFFGSQKTPQWNGLPFGSSMEPQASPFPVVSGREDFLTECPFPMATGGLSDPRASPNGVHFGHFASRPDPPVESGYNFLGSDATRSASSGRLLQMLSHDLENILNSPDSPAGASTRRTLAPRAISDSAVRPAISPQPSAEHPLGEQPSRTLFVRNIGSSVEESELESIFEAYGPLRNMYTLCKHRGFVMISYNDIRHAERAKQDLQGILLGEKHLDIHYSIPKENPTETDLNQGVVVVYNLQTRVGKEELQQLFGQYGEIRAMWGTRGEQHAQFIEFYDIRCAAHAMDMLHNTKVRASKIQVELARLPTAPATPTRASQSETCRPKPSTTGPELPEGRRNQTSRSISLPAEQTDDRKARNQPAPTTPRSKRERQFLLDLESVRNGQDQRTTLMIKNIPNKYSQQMLLAMVDETHQGTYDFIYLPIDFKNKCNVGYAFISFLHTDHIISFYKRLHNRKWSQFNSEKVCHITYARIQGQEALVAHFQNSSLMNEDPKCRPVIFDRLGRQVAFPAGVRPVHKERKPRRRSASAK